MTGTTSRVRKTTRQRRLRVGLLAGGALIAASGVASAADVFNGQRLYVTHCAGCHGDDGRGVAPGAPDFRRASSLLRPDAELLLSMRSGRGTMPGYQGVLDRYQMLDLIAYLRTLN